MSNTTRVEAALNAIASQLPLIDKSDLSGLASILGKLEGLTADKTMPRAFRGLGDRSTKLVNLMIMGETDFDAGLKKLTESVLKLQKGLHDFKAMEQTSIAPIGPADHNESEPIDDDEKDLLVRFAGQVQPVLEDFESYILELDKGNPQARGAIKRTLHTWKGEFGVLDLGEYSGLVHDIEAAFEDGRFGIDHLFRFKDFLLSRLSQFAAGTRPGVTAAERSALLGPLSAAPTPAPNNAPVPDSESVPTSGENAFAGDPSLMGDFIAESREHIHTAESLLLELETDPSNAENLNSIFRACHTIKGVAGFLDLKDVSKLAHSMENMMDMARKGELLLRATHIDVLLEATDCMKELVVSVEKTMGGEAYVVPETFAAVIERLSSPFITSTQPNGQPAESAGKKLGEILVEKGLVSSTAVAEAMNMQAGGDSRKLGQILIEKNDVPVREVAGALAAQGGPRDAQHKTVEESIRVPITRLDQLIDAIGEAVIAQSMIFADSTLAQLKDQGLDKKMAQAGLIMRQIQELSMSLRMVSIKATFQKMARLVRDLSKKVNKDVNFVTEGEDTELDKSVVENIGDPLIHMVRNSLDHGIEPQEDRASSGKPLTAKVVLRAYHKAGNIFIEIEDDGRGLDLEAIRSKAISRGLCKPDDKFSDQEIYQFIFLPGFSTAKVVTDVSGRGVGMDVVKRNIEALRGSCDIQSEKGKGTKFTIRLPLTLAIIDGMVVRVNSDNFIVPTLSIVESLKPSADQLGTIMGCDEMVKVRGNLIPLIRLASLFGNERDRKDPTNCIVMIVEDMLGKRLGLLVDEILGQQQVVIKSLGDGMGAIPGVSGGAIMSDGAVSLILDISGIMQMATETVEIQG